MTRAPFTLDHQKRDNDLLRRRWQRSVLQRIQRGIKRLTSAIIGSGRAAPQEGPLPLSGEVVADVIVAITGIKPQAAVKWKRLIKLLDPLAGISDRRRSVRRRRRLGQRQRWCGLNWRDVGTAAASRGEPGGLRALGGLLPCRLPSALGALRAAHSLHDNRRSIARRNLCRTLGGRLPLGAGRRGRTRRPKEENRDGKTHHP
jgi:hypothetical protein